MPARILVVDDSAADRLALTAVLAPLDREVVPASSGEEALKHMLATEFAVVLLDVKMEGIDGFETAGLMRSIRRTRATPIIFVTAFDKCLAEASRAYELGAFDYINKPFDADIVRHKVAGFVRLYEQEEQLRQQDVYIGVLGHDLRNPLNAIMMAAQTLQSRKSITDEDRLTVERIARAAERMDALIGDILDFTRAKLAGGIPLTRQRTALDEVSKQVVEELQVTHSDRPLIVDVAGDVVGEWDAGRVGQAISNLIDNALQHCTSGPVHVRVDGTAADVVRIEVSNRGCIASEIVPRLFEPFRRGEGNSAGLGLGLYIVREIARAHDGRIDVATDCARDETTFTIELPRHRLAA
jgi:signal transduction histidine kinase